MADTLADPVAILDEIAVIEKRIEEATAQLKDAKSRLRKAQDASRVQPGANMSDEEKMALIKVNLAEVLNPEIMDEALKKQGHLKVYWGTATTGRPHCGYVGSRYDERVACTAND
jgi:tyrosyl-tRNA synthetase